MSARAWRRRSPRRCAPSPAATRPLSVPLFAGVGGFLTGGGSAANAMLMPMVTALARAIAVDPAWIAAVQNSVCTNLTMLSPIRVSMGAGDPGARDVRCRALPPRLAARPAAAADRFRRHRAAAVAMSITRRRLVASASPPPRWPAPSRPARAIIILDSTWRAEGGRPGRERDGFRAHIALANQPQFDSLIALSKDNGQEWNDASGTWLGNFGGVGYVLERRARLRRRRSTSAPISCARKAARSCAARACMTHPRLQRRKPSTATTSPSCGSTGR